MNIIVPDWPAPDRVNALTTMRQGGVSQRPYDSFNLGDHVGDDVSAVNRNRQQLQQQPGLQTIQWLRQVHGTTIIEAGQQCTPEADASFSRQPGVACAVMTADCLPVLFCDQKGSIVAAAHAGWRGLLNGVLEATVHHFNSDPGELMAWLGPAISRSHFEVGPEVREQFVTAMSSAEEAFIPSTIQRGHYMADIYQLARQRLSALGMEKIYGGEFCTYADAERFYSYRRDGDTGRMATLIYLQT